jgi:hypothetical protein
MIKLSKIHDEYLQQIRDKYPMLYCLGDAWAIDTYKQLEEGVLKEFIATVPAEKTKERLQALIPDLDITIKDEIRDTVSIKIVIKPYTIHRIDDILNHMKKYGWFMAFWYTWAVKFRFTDTFKEDLLKVTNQYGEATLVYEAVKDREDDVEDYYFHITPDIYIQKIDKVGLSPKTQSKLVYHPGRVYLMKPGIQEYILDRTAELLYQNIKKEVKHEVSYMQIYKIYTKEIKNFKVHVDPNFLLGEGAVFTLNNIPPSSLEKYRQIPISDFETYDGE